MFAADKSSGRMSADSQEEILPEITFRFPWNIGQRRRPFETAWNFDYKYTDNIC